MNYVHKKQFAGTTKNGNNDVLEFISSRLQSKHETQIRHVSKMSFYLEIWR